MDETLEHLPPKITEIRQKNYAELAAKHGLTAGEIQRIHESTLEKLASIEPKYKMFIMIALPAAIERYKREKEIGY